MEEKQQQMHAEPMISETEETISESAQTMEHSEINQTSRKKWFLRIPLILAGLLAAAAITVFGINRFTFDVQLAGERELVLEYGQIYQEPGAVPVLKGSLFLTQGIQPETATLQTVSDLREDVLGQYTLTYEAEFWWWKAAAQRTVRIVDTQKPVITLKQSGKTILPGQHYEEEGYTVQDNYDGDLTAQVVRTEDFETITYTVTDSSGNTATARRKIPYFDPLPPEIILEGQEHMVVPAGIPFVEPGYQATDNAHGDMTELVAVDGEVIWYRPGTYELWYLISDSYGNVTYKTRTVEVTAQPRPEVKYPNGKVIYLTFDDGPGPHTGQLLDLLKHYGVKATFFVTDSGYDAAMRRIVNEGHSIGIHTMTHDYYSIYASEEAFFADLYGMQEIIFQNTGVMTTLMRFPGGGSNLVSRYNEGIMSTLTEAVQDAGFQYFDWNVDSNDAGGARKKKTVAANVIDGVSQRRISVVLQHDIHDFSVAAVEDIILWGLENGYTFLPLKEDSPTYHHTVLN